MRAFAADQPDRVAFIFERNGRHDVHIGEQADAADGRRRQDGGAATRRLRFIIEADIA